RARLCLRQLPGKTARADCKRGDRGNSDRGAKAHRKSRCNADPEQALRQGEYQHDDRPRARPQPHCDNRRDAAPQPMLAGQFTRLRRMRVAPGRGFIIVVMMMVAMAVMFMTVRMAMMVIVVMAVIVRVMGVRFTAQQMEERPAFHPQ